MNAFQCNICGYKPVSIWERLRSMHKGSYSERYLCSECKSEYKIKTNVRTLYLVFVLSMMILSFLRIIPFFVTVILIFGSYPVYLVKAPLQLIKNSAK